jgi:zinc transport system substrate-binding protein
MQFKKKKPIGRIIKNIVGILLVSIITIGSLMAQGIDEQSAASTYESYSGQTPMGMPVVASTSWVAAMARAAGADRVTVLAPMELKHPPEYDFRPGDIIAATQAQWVLWAGYEGFMKNLVSAAGIAEDKVILVTTNNTPPVVKENVRILSERLGTLPRFADWEKQLDVLEGQLREGATASGVAGRRAAVQFHHQALAKWLGYDVVAVFGPGELTMTQLQQIDAMNPEIIIDNWHMAQGDPLKKEGRAYVQFLNFPGAYGTESILDVLQYNAKQLGIIR